MNQDYRVIIGFFDHPKTVKLQRRLGERGVIALMRIWEYAAKHRCKGIFFGLDEEDLLIAAHWNEKNGDLIDSLADVGFLDREDEGVLIIHDWQEHNGWAFYADERSDKARRAANKRWNKECNEHATSNAPSPYPDPLPKPVSNRLGVISELNTEKVGNE